MSGPAAFAIALVTAVLLIPVAWSEESKVVIGPRNLDLADGAPA